MLPQQRPPADPHPWVGYIRVSLMREDAVSPDLQRKAITEWAARSGAYIAHWVEDLDQTGRHFKRRIQEAISYVERGEARGIAVWKFSRFGRDRYGIAMHLARVEQCGGQLRSATEDIDADTDIGKLNRGILFELAAFESDRAGTQWKEAHQWRREHGLPATGGKRLGYIWHPRKLPDPDRPGKWILQEERYDPDPAIADDIVRLYERKIAGEGYGALAEWLGSLGHRTGHDRPWQVDNLRRYMDAGFPAGLLRIHDPECHCNYKENGGRCTRWTMIPGAHPAIISPELWEQYKTHRAQNKARTPRSRRPVYALTGLMRCGTCRADTGATSARRRGQQILGYAYYCGTHGKGLKSLCPDGVWVQRAIVEDEVLRWLEREAAADIDAAPSTPVVPAVDHARDDAARRRAHALTEHQRVTDALQRLAVDNAMDPTKYPPGVFEAARDRLVEQQQQWAAEAEQQEATAAAPDRGPLVRLIIRTLPLWRVMGATEQNSLLRTVLRRVVVTRTGRGAATVECHPRWKPDPWETTTV